MIVFEGRGILLDVEGTTSSISFVYDVLFTHAKEHIAAFLAAHASDANVLDLATALTAAAGSPLTAAEIAADPTRAALAAIDLMNQDVKDTSLKALQGMIWRSGFESGQIVSHINAHSGVYGLSVEFTTLARYADSLHALGLPLPVRRDTRLDRMRHLLRTGRVRDPRSNR